MSINPETGENNSNIWQKSVIMPIINKCVAWGILFSAIYILRSFFLLVFFTFVFAYIQTRGVKRLEKYIKNRTVRVLIMGLFILGLLSTTGIFLVPKVKHQTEIFISKFTDYVARMDEELYIFGSRYPIIKELIPQLKIEASSPDHGTATLSAKSPTMTLLQQLAGLGEEASGFKNINQMIEKLGGISGRVAATSSAFLLSLLFSFLIVFDMPNLRDNIENLKNTKLSFIYSEVSENIRDFTDVMGKSLEAQLIIAILNSFLTAIGISILGMGHSVAFLSVIVFFCSFIPVAGVFVSSIPICLIALQTSGLQTMLLSIIMVIIIHLVEGYILNPRIYGTYMRINPVIVLIILTIGGKLFNIWGLILGVPVCTYIFGYAIKKKQTEFSDKDNKQLHEQDKQT